MGSLLLHEFKSGHLYSIDQPGNSYNRDDGHKWQDVHNQSGPGWLVPDYLKSRWTLLLGTSSNLLPRLVEKVAAVDIFYHDSEHTYANMLFEFEQVWPNLKEKSYLCSDNVNWNDAFLDFCRNKRLTGVSILFPYFGIVRKCRADTFSSLLSMAEPQAKLR